MSTPNVFNIPAGFPFLRCMASSILDAVSDAPETLSDYLILLPTRRGCREMQTAFLRQTEGRPLLLPRIQPIGDIDPDDMLFQEGMGHFFKNTDKYPIPPAISSLKRTLLLARTIQAIPDYKHRKTQAIKMAEALGSFIDQVYIEQLSFNDIHNIVPEEFAEHWQVSLTFLSILGDVWPKVLEDNGVIDAADYRNRQLDMMVESLRSSPPEHPIIAGGSTGSIPATRKLLHAISECPNGAVILPGLDQNLDDASWEAVDEIHPQFYLKKMITHFGITRRDVKEWPCTPQTKADEPPQITQKKQAARSNILTEIMRPARTLSKWMDLKTSPAAADDARMAFENVQYYPCPSPEKEALLIALIIRDILETPNKTVCLVTPDRYLARRVSSACRRWNIQIDDSGGKPLKDDRAGSFLLLVLQCVLSHFSPVPLLSLLKHPYCNPGYEGAEYRRYVRELDLALRGTKPVKGFKGIRSKIDTSYLKDKDTLLNFVSSLETLFEPLSALIDNADNKLKDVLQIHIDIAEKLAAAYTYLWAHEDGEAAANLLYDISEHAYLMQDMSLHEYTAFMTHMMGRTPVRPKYGTHPRVTILGQLEARLIDSDVVILGSLNEGQWPPAPKHDMWMSRPMRNEYGLPIPDVSIGQAAHDFCQLFCHGEVIMTRSQKVDGAPTVSARWLQRLDTVLQAFDDTHDIKLGNMSYANWAAFLDTNEDGIQSCGRPAPAPPVEKRPRELSATRIETLIRDPYSIYAQKILNLKKLDDLEQPIGPLEKGNWIHDVLEEFVKTYPDKIEDEDSARDHLLKLGWDTLGDLQDNPTVTGFWWPKFQKIADWFIAHEMIWRDEFTPVAIEVQGKITRDAPAGPFTLTAKADRIDKNAFGNAAVIDYKTGTAPTQKNVHMGISPQLAIEAAILQEGGFENIRIDTPEKIQYWSLTGNEPAGNITNIKAAKDSSLSDLIETTLRGIDAITTLFDDPNTSYINIPNPDIAPAYQDYAHLGRVKEWSVADADAE